MERLITLLRRLRGPDGCPWDREQTNSSLAPFLLEETYELLEAIAAHDTQGMREELGDLLLHIAFQTILEEERGSFTLNNVIEDILAKITSRHAHVLSGQRQEEAATWETRKARERGGASIMEGIPRSLPALLRAWRYQQRAAEVGFDWPSLEARWAKVVEEMGELEEAVNHTDREEVNAELGDLLFALVGFGRHMGLVAEDSLHAAASRFASRFATMEQLLTERGVPVGKATLPQMEIAWEEVKAREGTATVECREDLPST